MPTVKMCKSRFRIHETCQHKNQIGKGQKNETLINFDIAIFFCCSFRSGSTYSKLEQKATVSLFQYLNGILKAFACERNKNNAKFYLGCGIEKILLKNYDAGQIVCVCERERVSCSRVKITAGVRYSGARAKSLQKYTNFGDFFFLRPFCQHRFDI